MSNKKSSEVVVTHSCSQHTSALLSDAAHQGFFSTQQLYEYVCECVRALLCAAGSGLFKLSGWSLLSSGPEEGGEREEEEGGGGELTGKSCKCEGRGELEAGWAA